MKPLMLLWGLLAVAIFFTVSMYLREGFADPVIRPGLPTPEEVAGDTVNKCQEKIKCGDCLSIPQCGWCSESSACIPRINTYSIIPKWLTDLGKTCLPDTFIKIAGKCPDAECSSITSCRDCAGNVKCGWCPDAGKCLPKDATGNPVVPTGETCLNTTFVTTSGSCPAVDCTKVTSCATCTNSSGCGFCKNTNTCFTMTDARGVPQPTSCPPDKVVTFESQCADALTLDIATAMVAAGGVMGNNSPAAPQETNEVRPQTGPVSPATSYSNVTAPGVARPVGASSVPASVRHDPALGDAPLESYVKMLVNSQLAAQGIPTNEPFQVRETDAIPNATDYMKKVFRGVFS